MKSRLNILTFKITYKQGGTGYLGSEKYKMQTNHAAALKPPQQVPHAPVIASYPPPISATKKFLQDIFASSPKGSNTNSQSPGKKFFGSEDELEKNVTPGCEQIVTIAEPIKPISSPMSSKYDNFVSKNRSDGSPDARMKSSPAFSSSMPPGEHTADNNNKALEPLHLTVITQSSNQGKTANYESSSRSLSPSVSPKIDSLMTSNYSSPMEPYGISISPDLYSQTTSSLSTSRYSSPLEVSSAIPDSPSEKSKSNHNFSSKSNSNLNSDLISKPISNFIISTPNNTTLIPNSSADTTSSVPSSPLESFHNEVSPTIISPLDSRSSTSPSSPFPISSHIEKKSYKDNYNNNINNNNNNNSYKNNVNNFQSVPILSDPTPIKSDAPNKQLIVSTPVQLSTVQSNLKIFGNNSNNSNNNNNNDNNSRNNEVVNTQKQQQQQQQNDKLILQQPEQKRVVSLVAPVRHFVPPMLSSSNSDKNILNTKSSLLPPVSPSQRKSASYKDFLNTNINTNTNSNTNYNVNIYSNKNSFTNKNNYNDNINNNGNSSNINSHVQSMEQKKSWRVASKEESVATSSTVAKPNNVNKSVLSRYSPNSSNESERAYVSHSTSTVINSKPLFPVT